MPSEKKKIEGAPSGTGSREQHPSAAALTGFDPSRGLRSSPRVLVCGGRDFNRYVHIYDVLTDIQDERGLFEAVIAGRHPGEEPNGADYWAESWSFMQRIPFYGFPARWGDLSHSDAVIRTKAGGQKYDAKAGPRRNQRMIDEGRPNLVVAFPRANGGWGPGTSDMMRRAQTAGIEVIRAPLPQGVEARSDETRSGSAGGESPVPEGQAPQSLPLPQDKEAGPDA